MELTQDILLELFRSATEGILLADRTGTILATNPSLCTMFGYEEGELDGQKIEVLVPMRLEESHIEFRQGYFRNPKKRPMGRDRNLAGRRKHGKEFPVEVGLNYLKVGEQSLVMALVTDITEKRQHERELKQALIEGQENERRRLAADLHDGLGPLLSAVRLRLSTTQSTASDTAKLLDQAMGEVRTISHDLMPGTLDDFGLNIALEDLCRKLQGREAKLRCRVSGAPRPIEPKVELALFRIAQELLNNAIRHAEAKKIELQLIYHPDSLVLMVEDDGKGFKQGEGSAVSGIGLRNIESRAETIGAAVHLDSQPGRGATISVELPLDAS